MRNCFNGFFIKILPLAPGSSMLLTNWTLGSVWPGSDPCIYSNKLLKIVMWFSSPFNTIFCFPLPTLIFFLPTMPRYKNNLGQRRTRDSKRNEAFHLLLTHKKIKLNLSKKRSWEGISSFSNFAFNLFINTFLSIVYLVINMLIWV